MGGSSRWIREPRSLAKLVPVAGAVVAAVIVLVVHVAFTQKWKWLDFADDLICNLLAPLWARSSQIAAKAMFMVRAMHARARD